jgi:hypothetical protein
MPEEQSTPTRQCGRCRVTFAGDPTLHPIAQREWWLCAPCREVLLPDRSRNPAFRAHPASSTSSR